MRILTDTNILFSSLVFPKSKPAVALKYVVAEHQLVLTDQNIAELKNVIRRKIPDLLPDIEVFLAALSFELIHAIDNPEKLMRDATDQPILNAAILSDVDLIITGDKDFLCLEIEKPRCITPAQFIEEFEINSEDWI